MDSFSEMFDLESYTFSESHVSYFIEGPITCYPMIEPFTAYKGQELE